MVYIFSFDSVTEEYYGIDLYMDQIKVIFYRDISNF